MPHRGYCGYDLVQKAIRGEINIDAAVFHNNEISVLMCASWNGDIESVTLLLNAGACIDKITSYGKTAISSALIGPVRYPSEGHMKCAQLLTEMGADIPSSRWHIFTTLFDLRDSYFVRNLKERALWIRGRRRLVLLVVCLIKK